MKETEDYNRRTGEEHSRQTEEREQRPGGLTCLAFGGTVRTLVWMVHQGQVAVEWLTSMERYIHSSVLNVGAAGLEPLSCSPED